MSLRVLSALLLAPPFLILAYVGGLPFLGLVGLLVAAGAWEFGRFALGPRIAARWLVGISSLAVTAIRFAAPGAGGPLAALATATVVAALIVGLAEDDPAEGARTAALAILGSLYVGWLLSFLVALRELPRELAGVADRGGVWLIAAPTLLVWATDIGAFFAGRALGGRKLLPRVSPAKTVAGAVGGAAAAGALGAALFGWAPSPLPATGPAAGLGLGLAASLLAQTGDLAESLLKRAFGVKDSSHLIAGHGGVLDRFDALLFTAPAAYYFFRAALA